MLGNLIAIADIFSGSLSRSTQGDGQQQLAISRERLGWNRSAQGQDNLQDLESPNDVAVRVTAFRPRTPGTVDLVAIENIQSVGDAESMETQSLGQEAAATHPYQFGSRRLFGDVSNDGTQRQRSTQWVDAYNRVRAQAENPDTDGALDPGPAAQILVDNVGSDAAAKNTQLQDVGQNAWIQKVGRSLPKSGIFCPPPQPGGDAENDADQSQLSDQQARGRNHVGLSGMLSYGSCAPLASQITGTNNRGRTDSLQAQSLAQVITADTADSMAIDPADKVAAIAESGPSVQNGTVTDIVPIQEKMLQKVADHVESGTDPGNEQYQIGVQRSDAAYRAHTRNAGNQDEVSDQQVGRPGYWVDFRL
jgi:hypothetical protein